MRQHRSRIRRVGAAAAIAVAALAALPASSMAGEKFGAYLGDPVTPVASPEACPGGAGACTRAPLYYLDPPHAGSLPYVPHNGTLDKVKVIASGPGSFRLQLAKHAGGAPSAQVKVKANGPRIRYQGTGSVETFNVNVHVRQGWWLAQKAQQTSALTCDPDGGYNEAIVQPALTVSDPFTSAAYFTGCTHLVQGVME